MAKTQTTPEVIAKFRKKHGDKYDYSKVDFQGSHTKVTIICPDHGEFQQTPAIHIRKSGCPECGKIQKGKSRRLSPKAWIEKARAVHGDRYDYTPTVYTTNRSKVTVNCRIHGAFDILPDNHLKGSGCRICGLSSDKQLNGFDPTKEFRAVHGDRYDYSSFIYEGSHQKSKIICPEHGPFEQSYYVHKSGHGCPECGRKNSIVGRTHTQKEIIDRFTAIHGDRYDYSRVRFVHIEQPVTIVCADHGEFQQLPKAHFNGSGCTACTHVGPSKAETQIGDFIEQLGFRVIRNTRSLIGPKEIDIYIPDANLAIEYCGLYWHGERSGKDQSYHQSTMELLNQKGIDLITIFEDEWLGKPEVVKTIIQTRLGKSPQGVGGRKLTIRDTSPGDSRKFLNLHHIQGAATGSVHLGAYDGDELVGLMLFGNPTRQTSSYEWELKRFVANGKIYPGMMSKLFGHFIKTYHPESIVSFSDNRWFNGTSYSQLGFHKDGEIASDYYYHRMGIRYNKSRFRKAGIQRYHPEIYDEKLTERVMMEMTGYDRIWDCGKIRWVWIDPLR